MKHAANIICAGLFFVCGSVAASDLLGETLTFSRAYPTTDTPYWNPSSTTTTVTAGTADAIVWKWVPGISGTTIIDPESNSIAWSGYTSQYIGGQSVFDGFVVSGFSRDITSVNVVDPGGFSIELAPTLRSFAVNLSGFGSGFTVNVQLSPVPEPSAVVMIGAGLLALSLGKRFSRRTAEMNRM